MVLSNHLSFLSETIKMVVTMLNTHPYIACAAALISHEKIIFPMVIHRNFNDDKVAWYTAVDFDCRAKSTDV